jgi:hypothetical protein
LFYSSTLGRLRGLDRESLANTSQLNAYSGRPMRIGTLCYPGQPVPPGGCTSVVTAPWPRFSGGGAPNPCPPGSSTTTAPGTDHKDASDCGAAGGGGDSSIGTVIPPIVIPRIPPSVIPRVSPSLLRGCPLAGAIIIGHDLGVRAGECVRDWLGLHEDTAREQECRDRLREAHNWCDQYLDDQKRWQSCVGWAFQAYKACLKGPALFPHESGTPH